MIITVKMIKMITLRREDKTDELEFDEEPCGGLQGDEDEDEDEGEDEDAATAAVDSDEVSGTGKPVRSRALPVDDDELSSSSALQGKSGERGKHVRPMRGSEWTTEGSMAHASTTSDTLKNENVDCQIAFVRMEGTLLRLPPISKR
jgi:hypothetical protein